LYIIAEYLIIENFLINYFILQITKIITRTKTNRIRILVTALVSSLYSLAIFIPSLMFLTNLYMKLLLSLIITKLAYNSKSLGLYIKQLSAFYLVSFIFAGATLGIYYFINSSYNELFKSTTTIKGFPVKYLVLGVVFGGIITNNIFQYYQEKTTIEKELLKTIVSFNNKEASFTSLTDTGNSLVEPLLKSPVFVVEYKVIKYLLPADLRQIYEEKRESDYKLLEGLMKDLKEEMLIRLIPFKSLGSKNGMLIGFKPDYIIISDGNTQRKFDDLLIGIFNDTLSTDDQYNGLLSLEIIKRGKWNVI